MEFQKSLEILHRARENGDIVCIYPNSYSTKLVTGWAETVFNNQLILRAVTLHGRSDGLSAVELDRLERVLVDDEALQSTQLLVCHQGRENGQWQ